MPVRVELPYNWAPRDYQMPLWLAMEGGCKRALWFAHRRSGKDLTAINIIATKAMQRVGAYWHVFPTYKQGKKIAWEGRTKEGRLFLDHFPAELITRRREQEMTIDFVNGSSYTIVGVDNPDSQVGTNPVGVVLSEYALYEDDSIWTRIIQPILVENGGWALFITTPRGRNHAYRMLQRAKDDPSWFVEILPYQKTGAITKEQVDQAIRDGMSKDLAAQEFECSFDAALEHAFWGDQMRAAQQQGRIGVFPADPALPVTTSWDLGMEDATGIWWWQKNFGQYRVLRYRYGTGQSLGAYVAMLDEFLDDNRKAGRPLTYREHILPHDVKVRELGPGVSRLDTLRDLGVRNARALDRTGLQDGIQAVRSALANCWFNEPEVEIGIEGLRQYSRKPLENQFDPEGNQMFGHEPKKDWTCHPADSFRTGIVGMALAFADRQPGQVLAPKLAIC